MDRLPSTCVLVGLEILERGFLYSSSSFKGIRIPFSMAFESICFEPPTIFFSFFLCLAVKFERLVLAGMRLVGFIEWKIMCVRPLR